MRKTTQNNNDNPYSLTFGREPARMVSRSGEISRMVNTFNSRTPSTSVYIITGVRGSGKTVTMAALIDRLRSEKDWIICTLNPNSDLLASFAANLYEHPKLKAAFVKADIRLSLGAEVSVRAEGPAPDTEVQIKRMLRVADKLKKRVLIAVDEAVNSVNFRIFAGAYQMFLIEKLPVYLIMTGLYKNINALQNEKTLTFLYRAPKYELEPLSIVAMSNDYAGTLNIERDEADAMARLTKGYSYAFQVMGFLKYDNPGRSYEELLPLFDEIMEEHCYEKIWAELTGREKEVVRLLINSEGGRMRVKDIKAQTGLTDQSFPTYRRRLRGSGVISVSDYGYCELALPRFKDIVSRWGE